jgi:hypothetical protein
MTDALVYALERLRTMGAGAGQAHAFGELLAGGVRAAYGDGSGSGDDHIDGSFEF